MSQDDIIKIVAIALLAAIVIILTMVAAHAQAPFLYVLPPIEYDHPYTGELTIDTASDTKQVQSMCALPTPRIACSYVGRDWCRIIKISDDALRAMGWNPLHIWRHEHAHCNGWSNRHEGPRPAIAANDSNWPHDPRALSKPK